MGYMRDLVREVIKPTKVEQQSASSQLAEYARGMAEYQREQAEAKAAAEAAAATPQPATLVDELRQALEAHNAANDTPGLNDSRLLTALSVGEGSKSAKEAVAALLYRYRQDGSDDPITGRNE